MTDKEKKERVEELKRYQELARQLRKELNEVELKIELTHYAIDRW